MLVGPSVTIRDTAKRNDGLVRKASMMDDGPERLKLVYEIDKKLQEDAARPSWP